MVSLLLYAHIKKNQFSLWSIFNGAKSLENYSDDSSDRLNEATLDGTPSWYTINLKWIYKHSDRIQFNAALENVLDKSYKPFSSGPFAPGRNFIIAVKMKL
jgi:hemoglobin/transferrin/lactoferrin receptor protein